MAEAGGTRARIWPQCVREVRWAWTRGQTFFRAVASLMPWKPPAAANSQLQHFWEAMHVLACRPCGALYTRHLPEPTRQLVQQRKRGA